MSMRIQSDSIGATGNSQSTSTVDLQQQGSTAQRSGGAGSSGDEVSISSLTGGIADSSNNLATQEAARVSQLAALYSRGEYQVDSGRLSSSLVSSALQGRSTVN